MNLSAECVKAGEDYDKLHDIAKQASVSLEPSGSGWMVSRGVHILARGSDPTTTLLQALKRASHFSDEHHQEPT